MAVSVKTAMASSAVGSSAVTGVGFSPKVILFLTADPNGASVNTTHGFGAAATGSGQAAIFCATNDNFSPPTNAAFCSAWPDKCMGRTDGSTTNWTATVTSYDSDGFTCNFSGGHPGNYNYLAIGGSDITNVKVGVMDITSTAGNQAITGVGFRPDVIITAAIGGNSFSGGASLNNGNDILSIGFSDGTNSYNSLFEFVNNNPSIAKSVSKTGTISSLVDSTPSFIRNLNLASFDSDGFTISKTTAPSSTQSHIYVVLKGGRWKVGAETSKTSNGTKATTGVGWQPKGVFFAGGFFASSSSPIAHAQQGYGAYDGTNNTNVGSSSVDGANPSNCATNRGTTICTGIPSGATGAIVYGAAGSSLDSDGFTLNWTATDATAREFGYLAVTSNAAAGGGGSGAGVDRRMKGYG